MKALEIEKADFDKLLTRLRKRGMHWTTWRIEGKMYVYTGRANKRIVKQEIKALQGDRQDGGEE